MWQILLIFPILMASVLFAPPSADAANAGFCNDMGEACCNRNPEGTYGECQPPLTCNVDGLSPTFQKCIAPPYLCPNLNGIQTAIGCIPISNQNQLFAFFLRWGVGIVGGIGFLIIIIASVIIITSTGDPRRLQAGKELLTAAVAGVMLLVFSVFILRVIGVNILQLPILGG